MSSRGRQHRPNRPNRRLSAVRSIEPVKLADGITDHRKRVIAVVGGALVAVGCVARFVTVSPMWLDEALSVNIASLSLGDIPDALRHDGHPPLYYFLLHVWMDVFGTSDLAIRAMSGLVSLATLPLAFVAGRRLGGTWSGLVTVLVLALNPYAVRYGSEARMYSLVVALVFAGIILMDRARVDARRLDLLGVALVSAALLLTHYWSMWLLGTVGLLLLYKALRSTAAVRRAHLLTAGAVAAGGVLFLPWVGVLLYQSEHTGTPWGVVSRPADLVARTLTDFGGGFYGETHLLAFCYFALALVGIFGFARSDQVVELRLTRRDPVEVHGAVFVGALAVASVMAYVANTAFHPRYAAIVLPSLVLLVAGGIARFQGGVPRAVVLASVTLLSLIGIALVCTEHRSASGEVFEAVEATGVEDALLVACPDQMGPALNRAFRDRPEIEVVAYPSLGDPRLVDWADYEERNVANDAGAIAREVMARAAGRPLFVAYHEGYRTFEGQCSVLVSELSTWAATNRSAPAQGILSEDPTEFYEPMNLLYVPV